MWSLQDKDKIIDLIIKRIHLIAKINCMNQLKKLNI